MNAFCFRCRARLLKSLLICFAVLNAFVTLSSNVSAQILTVKQLNEEKPRWNKLASDQKPVQFVGRYRSLGRSLQLDKFEVPCRLPSTIQLPERLPEGEVMEITGKFVQENGRLSFRISRIVYRGLPWTELNTRATALGNDKPEELLNLANQYVEQAEFYSDKKLLDEIQVVRRTAIGILRSRAKSKLDELRKVQTLAASLNIEQQFQKNLAFEVLFTRAQDQTADIEPLLTDIRKLDAWDRQVPPVPDDLRKQFETAAPSLYDSGTDAQRELLHRQLYSVLRIRQIRGQLKDDGSNGLELADLVRQEFSDQTELCNLFEQREVDYQLSQVDKLSRQELQLLTTLLTRLKKDNLTDAVLRKWLDAQESQFGLETLAGLLRTADEYLFVGDTWKKPDHHERGIELLKKSWTLASTQSPDDARLITERLAALGWEQLGGRWLTKQQMQSVPRDDLQLALREGRVVRGMTSSQVAKFLGKPSRIARVGTSRSIAELWIYDAEGSAGMVVRFQKNSAATNKEESVVAEVSRLANVK